MIKIARVTRSKLKRSDINSHSSSRCCEVALFSFAACVQQQCVPSPLGEIKRSLEMISRLAGFHPSLLLFKDQMCGCGYVNGVV